MNRKESISNCMSFQMNKLSGQDWKFPISCYIIHFFSSIAICIMYYISYIDIGTSYIYIYFLVLIQEFKKKMSGASQGEGQNCYWWNINISISIFFEDVLKKNCQGLISNFFIYICEINLKSEFLHGKNNFAQLVNKLMLVLKLFQLLNGVLIFS